jgi:hypothetical protein
VSTTPDPGTDPSAADDAAELWGRQYDGTAQLSVDVHDYCSADGSRHLAETKRYSMTGTLELGRPRDGGGETENNPFTLVLSVGQPSEAGAVSFWSSAVSTASGQDLAGNPRDPRVLLTYWDLEWDSSTLTGELTDAHAEEGITLNLVNWPGLIVPCRPDLGSLPGGYPHAVGTGSTLEGELDAGGTSLTARGTTGDGALEFEFSFAGTT